MSAAQSSSWRVLIGAGNFADAQSALALVEQLAGARLAELGGVFLEEEHLADVIALPAQRVVTFGGALTTAPTRKQLGSLLDREARAFHEMLSSVAQSRKWRFERRRGELMGSLCKAAEGWDILLVGHRVARSSHGRVALIAPPKEATPRAAALAGELAQALGASLISLSLRPGPAAPEQAQAAVEQFDDAEALLSRLRRMPVAALVLDVAAGPFRSADELRRVHMAARCPLIVLGGEEIAG